MSTARAASCEAVLAIVDRCRRRMRLVSIVRRAGVTIPVAIVAVELVALLLRPTAIQLTAVTATAGLLAAIAAAIPAILRAPSMRATAAAIDARFHLQDRVVTALQHVDDHDPMGQLVVRDAAMRLTNISPPAAFPFQTPLHFRVTMIATAMASIVFLIVAGAPGSSWLTARGGSNGASGAGGGRAGRTATPGPNAQIVERAAPSASDPRRQPASTPEHRADAPVGRESTPNQAATQARGRGGDDTPAADSSASAQRRDAGSASGARDGGRGATGFAEQAATAAGGVNGARNSNPLPAASRATPAPGTATYRDDYRSASARAQAAIAQERVPVRLRTYVKRYFVAIHP